MKTRDVIVYTVLATIAVEGFICILIGQLLRLGFL